MVRFLQIVAGVLGGAVGLFWSAAQAYQWTHHEALPIREVLAKASPDECFVGIGLVPGEIKKTGRCREGDPKVNEAYVWGLTETHRENGAPRYFFGTGPNIHCLVIGGFLQVSTASRTESWVCEGEESFLVQRGLPAALGDFRPSSFYYYDDEDELVDLTPQFAEPANGLAEALRRRTIGIRAAGSLGDVVLFAGPTFPLHASGTFGVAFYAFDAQSGALIGAQEFTELSNVRRSAVIDGTLYFGVGATDGTGRVLRWTGDAGAPFAFETVGIVPGDVANITPYKDRIAISTWPAGGASQRSGVAAVYLSPVVDGALTAKDALGWRMVWNIFEYEPNPAVAAVIGGGDLAEFDGWLYWGTMVVPGLPLLAQLSVAEGAGQPIEGEDGLVKAALGTFRATTFFRGRDLDTRTPEIQLLYGEYSLPVYDVWTGRWSLERNRAGLFPLLGREGGDNPFANYAWTATVVGHSLFFGTMDWRYLLEAGLGDDDDGLDLGGLGMPAGMELGELESMMLSGDLGELATIASRLIPILRSDNEIGADLIRFDRFAWFGRKEDESGLGNELNYGIRNTLESESCLVAGTANPMNLEKEGGWELIRLCPDRAAQRRLKRWD
jgi:hypothetical protein